MSLDINNSFPSHFSYNNGVNAISCATHPTPSVRYLSVIKTQYNISLTQNVLNGRYISTNFLTIAQVVKIKASFVCRRKDKNTNIKPLYIYLEVYSNLS